jgi:hypothetical protein
MKYNEATGSLYLNVWDKNPTIVIIRDFLTDDSRRDDIERFRECSDLEERDAMKRNFPALVVSGLCEGSRTNFKKHNGLICVDIDGKDNPHITDWIEFVHSLRWMTNVWYCGLSVSGNGCFLIIGLKNHKKHEAHFRSIERFFSNSLGIVVDPQCVDKNRLRFQSFNTVETSWFNDNADLWKGAIDRKKPVSRNKPEFATQSMERVNDCVNQLEARRIDITVGNDWVKAGCALINEFGEAGRELFQRVSAMHAKYDFEETDKKYSYWQRRGYSYTIRTFFYLCKIHGIVLKSDMIDNQ